MDRLISLQAAIDVLHMDTSIIPYKKAREYADATILEIRNRLEDLPSAQPDLCDGCDRYGASCVGEGCGKLEMPEIIRCRDCKHFMKWRSEKSAKKFGQEYECECGRLNIPKPDDFCSRAKRKDDEKKNI